jgi:GntR family transcriptional regulator
MIGNYPGTLYSLYETHYGIRIIHAEERLRAVAADKTATDALGVKPNTPLLDIERLAYTYGDKPVEWRRSRCNSDQHCYFNRLG